jgi:hypothetical protein
VNNWEGKSWDAVSKELLSPAILLSEMLSDVELIIHIRFTDPEDHALYFTTLQQELIKQTIVLGRNEDIARLDKIYVIDL